MLIDGIFIIFVFYFFSSSFVLIIVKVNSCFRYVGFINWWGICKSGGFLGDFINLVWIWERFLNCGSCIVEGRCLF